MKKILLWIVSFACGCLILVALFLGSSVSNSLSCRSVYALFARGSGQKLDNNEEWRRFDQQLQKRLDSANISLKTYQLGTSPQNNHRYPAVDVNPNDGNTLSAWTSSDTRGAYGHSVNEGTLELGNYLIKLHSQCPQSRVVLGGYSQGAQVIGQSIRSLPREIRNKIVFAALFGDPKLFLPEGKGFIPPACLKKDPSPWRRDVGNCNVSSGVLGARDPYLPDDMKKKTGLWCLTGDVVCGSWENLSFKDTHGDYKNTAGAIDRATQEIASRLSLSLPNQNIKIAPDPFKLPEITPSIMFMFDNSMGMSPAYFNKVVKPTVNKIIDKKTLWHHGLGHLTYYGGNNEDFISFLPPKSLTGSSIKHFLNTIDFYPSETNISQDLVASLTWLQNSRIPTEAKQNMIVILFTNTPFEPLTAKQPATRSYNTRLASTQNNMVIYPVVPESIRASFNKLSFPGGRVIIPDGDIEDTFLDHVKNPQLEATFKSPNRMAPPGYTIDFDASASIVYDDVITKYEWDFESDGIYDRTTTTPTISRRYSTISTSTVTVRVSTATGLTDTDTRLVQIIDPATLPPIPKAPVNLKLKQTSATTVRLTWEPGDNLADTWIIALDDFPLGRVKKDQLFINISDVDTSVKNVYSVRALSAKYKQSEAATVTLAPGSIGLTSRLADSSGALFSSKASNLFKTLGSILGVNSQSNSTPLTLQAPDDTSISKKAPMFAYILIGIFTSALLASAGWLSYIFFKNRKSNTQEDKGN